MTELNLSWNIPKIADPAKIQTGDMPGDKIKIEERHILKANKIFQEVMKWLALMDSEGNKLVISVYGGSGVGKSEIASVLAYYLNHYKIGTYILSGDNYVRRRPELNDEERLRILNDEGLLALTQYLGSPAEIDFDALNNVIDKFKSNKKLIHLRRKNRIGNIDTWEDLVDFSKNHILLIEWTHGNSAFLKGVDFPIFLYSTPEETLEHRKKRNRDNNVDSPLINTVLKIEQGFLETQIPNAKLIISKQGEIIS